MTGITAEDLDLWANAGAAVPAAPPPNFRGDDVRFSVRDEAGNILFAGHMHRSHVEERQRAGENIFVEDDDHPGLPPPPPPSAAERLTDLRAAIGRELMRSDHYFLSDRTDVDDVKRAAWTDYRKKLRDARDLSDTVAMVAALPPSDPKGADAFVFFRDSKLGWRD